MNDTTSTIDIASNPWHLRQKIKHQVLIPDLAFIGECFPKKLDLDVSVKNFCQQKRPLAIKLKGFFVIEISLKKRHAKNPTLRK